VALTYKRYGVTRALTGLPGGSFGFERADSATLFTLGSFRVTTNLRPAVLPDPAFTLAAFGLVTDRLTLADLQARSLEEARAGLRYSQQLRLPSDPADLLGYASFGSLRQRLQGAMASVLANFPAGLVADPVRSDGARVTTVVSHAYNQALDQTSFSLATDVLGNPFGLNLHAAGQEQRPGQPDLLTAPERYVLDFNGQEYPLVSVAGLRNDQTGLLNVVAQGNPFALVKLSAAGLRLVLRPAQTEARAQFRIAVPELGLYLLGGAQAPLAGDAGALFRLPAEDGTFDPGAVVIHEVVVRWPRPDGYNVAWFGVGYQTYADQLLGLGDALDGYKTDLLLSRYVPTDSILALDETSGGKVPALLRVWGAQLDDTKQFIDALTKVHHLDYNPSLGLPDQLVRNLATTLGWDVSTLVDEDELLGRLYAGADSTSTSTIAAVLPVDLDTELWRRIALNTHFFMRAKGTRQAIESLLQLVGIPTGLLRFDEHAYLFTPSFDQGAATTLLDPLVGYGVSELTVPLVAPVYQNRAERGNYYAPYRATGQLTLLTDNRKVWPAPTADELAKGYDRIDLRRGTSYHVPAGSRVLPSKEISLSLSPARAYETAFYAYCVARGFPGAGRIPVGSLRARADQVVPLTGVAEFMEQLFTRFVDARTHQTRSSYPTLRGLLLAYEQENGSSTDLATLLAYTHRLNRYWQQLVRQMIPATTILRQQAITLSNPSLLTSKHRYRAGISVGSEFFSLLRAHLAARVQTIRVSGSVVSAVNGIVRAPRMSGRVLSGADALLSAGRRLRVRGRLALSQLVIVYPTVNATEVVSLLPKIDVPPVIVYYPATGGTGKEFTLSVAYEQVVANLGGIAPFEMGYAVYECRVGSPLVRVVSAWLAVADYVVDDILATATLQVPVALLRSDREYVVKSYLRTTRHRGSAAPVPALPWDLEDQFRQVTYPAKYRKNPKFVDPLSTGSTLVLTNEQSGPLLNTYFNSYRLGTDFYFPSANVPGNPLITGVAGVRPVGIYSERLTATNGGDLTQLRISYQALEAPTFTLGGVLLTTSNADYVPYYPMGTPLYFQRYSLAAAVGPLQQLIATYRTAYQPLAIDQESYTLGSSQKQYVDLVKGETPPAGLRIFYVGNPTAAPVALAFLTAVPAMRGSAQLNHNGYDTGSEVTDSLVLATGARLAVANFVFLDMAGYTFQNSDIFDLTYGVLSAAEQAVITPPTQNWTVAWSWPDRYALDLVPGRVDHKFVVELTDLSDYDFALPPVVLATVEIPGPLVGSTSKVIDLYTAGGGVLLGGTTYLVRVRAHKVVSLVNGTKLVQDAFSVTYRLRVPGGQNGLIDFLDAEFIPVDFY
jgi:hypothetical protein